MLFTPTSGIPKSSFLNIPHGDKIIHFGMFALLTVLFAVDNEKMILKTILYFSLFSVSFAASSELIQYSLITGRNGNIYDFLADMAGLAIGLLTYQFILTKYLVKKKIRN